MAFLLDMSLDASSDLVVTLPASSCFNFSMKLRAARMTSSPAPFCMLPVTVLHDSMNATSLMVCITRATHWVSELVMVIFTVPGRAGQCDSLAHYVQGI